jgi:hypothetical protein
MLVRRLGFVALAGIVALGCKNKDDKKDQEATEKASTPTGPSFDAGHLDETAMKIASEITNLETTKDVTCWTSFRQLDSFISSKEYSNFAALSKITAAKALVRAAWEKASRDAKGDKLTAADLTALSLPEARTTDDAKLAQFATETLKMKAYNDYRTTSEHWRLLLSVVQDEMLGGPKTPLKPLAPDALAELSNIVTRLSLVLLQRSGELAQEERTPFIEAAHVKKAHAEIAEKSKLTNTPREQLPATEETKKRFAPITKAVIDGKIKALTTYNKSTGTLLGDMNRLAKVPLTEEGLGALRRQLQSFVHFIAAGHEPMQADNFLSDGQFAPAKLATRHYIDAPFAATATLQLFPHLILANGDLALHFEPNPAWAGKKDRKGFEVTVRDYEQNAVRDTAIHWLVMEQVFKERPYAMDAFAAEYVSEVVSMMTTHYMRRAETLANETKAKEIKADVFSKVRDREYVQVMPPPPNTVTWTPEQEAKKKAALAKYTTLFKDVTAGSGVLAGLKWNKLPDPNAKGAGGKDLSHAGGGKDLSHAGGGKDLSHAGGGKDLSHAGGGKDPKDLSHAGGGKDPKDLSHAGGGKDPKDLSHAGGGADGGSLAHAGASGSHGNGVQKIMGSGVAVGDVNKDGYPDLFLAEEGSAHLFLNRGKEAPGKFTDATQAWGIPGGIGDAKHVVFFDMEGDGDLDLLVIRSDNPSLILKNDGGKYVDVTEAVGFKPYAIGAHVATIFDYDGDGNLDIYLGYYGSDASNRKGSQAPNLPSMDGKNGTPHQLWKRGADGKYTEVGIKAGVADTGWTLAVGAFDYDNDGKLDLFLANDFGPDVLYRNKGDGTFEDVSKITRTDDNGSGMNASFTDVNGDGFLDFYVSNIDMFSKNIKVVYPTGKSTLTSYDEQLATTFQYISGNKLYVNPADKKGKTPFIAAEGKLFEPGDRGWGWATLFFDYENDGDDDMYLSNGWIDGSTAANQKKQMFINDKGFFYLAPPASPEAVPSNGRAAIAFDMDRDGDLDLLLLNFRQAPVLLENTQAFGNHWVQMRLRSAAPNAFAIGARVTATVGGRKILREVSCGNGYLGQDEDVLGFGIGQEKEAEVSIRWPNGKTETLKVQADKVTDVTQKP